MVVICGQTKVLGVQLGGQANKVYFGALVNKNSLDMVIFKKISIGCIPVGSAISVTAYLINVIGRCIDYLFSSAEDVIEGVDRGHDELGS